MKSIYEESCYQHSFLITSRCYLRVPKDSVFFKIEKWSDQQIIAMLDQIILGDFSKLKTVDEAELLLNPHFVSLFGELVMRNKKLDSNILKKADHKLLILYDWVLRENIQDCAKKHSSLNEIDWLCRVECWFQSLCRMAAEGFRDCSYILTEYQISFLKKECHRINLKVNLCFSTFLDCYFNYKHPIQQEAMTAFHLRETLSFHPQMNFFMAIPPTRRVVERVLPLSELFNVNELMNLLHSLYFHWKRETPKSKPFLYQNHKMICHFEDFLLHFYFDLPYVEGLLQKLSQIMTRFKIKASQLMKCKNHLNLDSDFDLTVIIDVSLPTWKDLERKMKQFIITKPIANIDINKI